MYASNKARNPISLWYNAAQLEVTSTTEWLELSEQLYASVLAHSDSPSTFHTLSTQEKQQKVREAFKEFSSINNSSMLRISRAVTAAVNETLSRHRISERQSSLLTASEYILDRAGNASELKNQFNKYLNGNIPSHMRCLVWKSCLYTPNLERVIELTIKRQEHKGHIGNSQLKIKSLLSEFSDSIGSVSDTVGELMSESLYYYTEVIYQSSEPKMQHIKLLYPFVIAVLDSPLTSTLRANHTSDPLIPSKSNSAILSKILALYISFLQKAPEIIQSVSPTRGAEMWFKEFSLRVTSLIKTYDALLYHFLCGLTSNSEPQLVSSLAQLFKPFLQDLFVGHMQTSLVLFLWDNCFLCLDTPSIQFLPYAAACWLVILKRELMVLTRFDQLVGILETNSASISVRNMQETLQKLAPDLKSIFTTQIPLLPIFKKQTLIKQTSDSCYNNNNNITQTTDTQDITISTSVQETAADQVESIELVGSNNAISEIQDEQTNDVQSERNISIISDQEDSPVHTPDVETHRDTAEDNSTGVRSNSIESNMSGSQDGEITLEFWEKIINRFQKGLLNIAQIEVEPDAAL